MLHEHSPPHMQAGNPAAGQGPARTGSFNRPSPASSVTRISPTPSDSGRSLGAPRTSQHEKNASPLPPRSPFAPQRYLEQPAPAPRSPFSAAPQDFDARQVQHMHAHTISGRHLLRHHWPRCSSCALHCAFLYLMGSETAHCRACWCCHVAKLVRFTPGCAFLCACKQRQMTSAAAA